MNNTDNARKALIAGMIGTSAGLFLLGRGLSDFVISGSIFGLAEAQRRRHEYTYGQCIEGCILFGAESIDYVEQGFKPITNGINRKRIEITTTALKQLPMGDRIAARMIAANDLSTSGFKRIEDRPSIVLGESGDGKTHVLKYRLQRFLQAHSGKPHEVYIGDPDYGQSHPGSEPNTWFGIDPETGRVIFTDAQDIYATILDVEQAVKDRATQKDTPKPPILLLIDEWCNIILDWTPKQLERALDALRQIARRGLKQNVYVTLGLHSLAVSESALNKAILQQFEILALWRAAQEVDNYNNLGCSVDAVEKAIAKISSLPRVIGNLRPCVMYAEKKLSVQAVPQLQLDELVLLDVESQPTNPESAEIDRAWIQKDFDSVLRAIASRRLKQGKTSNLVPISEAWDAFGGLAKQRSESNESYLHFRSRVENFLKEFGEQEQEKTGEQTAEQGV